MADIEVVEVTNDEGITVVEVTIPGPQGAVGAGGGGGATAFTDLTDVPADYTGDALKVVRVNAGETGLEFSTVSGSGDVSKVGTPVDNQVGVWTGDGTIEGDTALTFDTSTDTLTIAASGNLAFGAVTIIDDTAGTTTLQNIDAIDATTETTLEAALDFGNVVKVGTPVDNQVGVWTGDGTIEGDTALTFDTTTDTLTIAASGNLAFGAVTVIDDAAGTTTLQNIDALDATTEATVEAAIDTLANLTSVQGRTVTLADAGANAFFGWDDAAGAYENLTAAEAEAIIEPLIDTLANLTSIQGRTVTLADAGADAIFGWDDSASAYENLTQQEALDVLGLGSVVTLTPAGANKTFYVATTGNDTTGDGSVGNPWLTIQHAVDQVVRYDYENLYTATINVADGTYNEGVGVRCLVKPYRYLYGNGVSIIGNTTTPANVVVNGTGDVFDISDGGWTIRGMTITSTGTGGSVWVSNGAEVSLGTLRFGNSPDHLVGSVRGASVTFIGNITITATSSVGLFRLTEYGTLFCEGISITISNAWNVGTTGLSGFVRATQHSTLWFDSNTITGHANVTGRKYVFGTFSHYDGSSGSPDYTDPDDLPGNSAGEKDNTVTIGNFTNGWYSGYEKAGAPSTSELPDGCWGVFDNTTAGYPLIAYNDAGTVKTIGSYNAMKAAIGITIDGGGSAITTGVKGDVYVPYDCTITDWTILADQTGSIEIDVWVDTYANYPPTVADTIMGGTGSSPRIVSADKAQAGDFTDSPAADLGTIAAGSTVRFNVNSASTITRATLTLTVLKT